MKVKISIIIPTYNSDTKILDTLESIARQKSNLPLEILIVDGGSTDQTLAIAKRYHATVIPNPHKHPEWAKLIGSRMATGQILVFLDSDESFLSAYAVEKRWRQLRDDTVAVVMSGGYTLRPESPGLHHYMNAFSDPFSFFMYGLSTDSELIHTSYKTRFTAKTSLDALYCVLNESDQLPLLDLSGGTAIRTADAKEHLHQVGDIARFLRLALKKRSKLAILYNDSVRHLLSNDVRGYISKINWRIVNNLFHSSQAGAGFSNRESKSSACFRLKALFFLPYSLFIVPAMVHAIPISWQKKKPLFIYHVAFSLYTAIAIMFFLALKLLKVTVALPTYGERKP